MPGESTRGVERAIQRAHVERSAGRAWRAKEILRGNLGTLPYDRRLYRAYGELQLELGEAMDAGRYLLLAGSEDPAHAEAVELYLGRCGHGTPGLHMSFPASARGLPLADYPERVRRIFEAGGWTPPLRVRRERESCRSGGPESPLWQAVLGFGGLFFFVASTGVGAVQILRWTWSAFTSLL